MRSRDDGVGGVLTRTIGSVTGGMPDWTQSQRVIMRLIAATLLGAVIGWQRERAGKAAGLRTPMLVAMGSALFVLSSAAAGMSLEGLSRVIQGLATGIGFIGAGAIMKLRDEREIEGRTTAAGIWMTSAAGVAAGLGRNKLAIVSVGLAWAVLAAVGFFRPQIDAAASNTAKPEDGHWRERDVSR